MQKDDPACEGAVQKVRKVLFFGDSNTYGCDPDGGHSGRRFPEEVRWTGILKKKLEGKWLVGEDGLNGRCIPEMKYETEALEESLRRNEPLDLFAVMLGTNDYLSRPHPDPDGGASALSEAGAGGSQDPLRRGLRPVRISQRQSRYHAGARHRVHGGRVGG